MRSQNIQRVKPHILINLGNYSYIQAFMFRILIFTYKYGIINSDFLIF